MKQYKYRCLGTHIHYWYTFKWKLKSSDFYKPARKAKLRKKGDLYKLARKIKSWGKEKSLVNVKRNKTRFNDDLKSSNKTPPLHEKYTFHLQFCTCGGSSII